MLAVFIRNPRCHTYRLSNASSPKLGIHKSAEGRAIAQFLCSKVGFYLGNRSDLHDLAPGISRTTAVAASYSGENALQAGRIRNHDGLGDSRSVLHGPILEVICLPRHVICCS